MAERIILSEKLEDNKIAAEWGIKQAELIKKGEEITQRLMKKYTPIILSRNIQSTISNNNDKTFKKSGE